MKITPKILIILIMSMFVILLVPYFFTFNDGLSSDSKSWANFGTYIGGTLGPIGAFLAFWGLIQQNKMYREHAEIDRVSLKLLALDSEVYNLTTHCIEHFTISTVNGEETHSYDLSILLIHYDTNSATLIPPKNTHSRIAGVTLVLTPQQKANRTIILSIESKLQLMNQYLATISNLDNKVESLQYNNKYCHLLRELKKKEWIDFDSFGEQYT